ncbi:MAG: hypothetical protein KAT15_21470 [Bacteroidales bacterium]|nr:hypothetical protein [Bacteroidales bacterium]
MIKDPISPTRDINHRLLLSLHQDGLFDILAGLIVITFGYGILVFICFVLFEHLFLKGMAVHHGIPAAAMISGGFIILSGAYLLITFLRRYRIDK